MRDEPHVGLVDAHAEGDRGGDHHLLGMDERGLVARAHLRLEAGVIRQRRPPVARELLGDLLGLVAARRIDDRRAGLRRQQLAQLLAGLLAVADMIADVRPVEAGDDQAVFGDSELGEDVGAGARVGGRGQRQPRHVGMIVEQRPQLAIVGPEVVAPFADAMRFVDRDQRQRRRRSSSRRNASSVARSGAT